MNGAHARTCLPLSIQHCKLLIREVAARPPRIQVILIPVM